MINKIINKIGGWLIKFSDDELHILAWICTCLIVVVAMLIFWISISLTIYGVIQLLEGTR